MTWNPTDGVWLVYEATEARAGLSSHVRAATTLDAAKHAADVALGGLAVHAQPWVKDTSAVRSSWWRLVELGDSTFDPILGKAVGGRFWQWVIHNDLSTALPEPEPTCVCDEPELRYGEIGYECPAHPPEDDEHTDKTDSYEDNLAAAYLSRHAAKPGGLSGGSCRA